MQLNIKKIIRPLDLGDYARELQGQAVYVWVNPTREALNRRAALDEELNRGIERSQTAEARAEFNLWIKGTFEPNIKAWFAEIWSQYPEPATHWTVSEIEQLEASDPALVLWLNTRTMQLIYEHRRVEKKS